MTLDSTPPKVPKRDRTSTENAFWRCKKPNKNYGTEVLFAISPRWCEIIEWKIVIVEMRICIKRESTKATTRWFERGYMELKKGRNSRFFCYNTRKHIRNMKENSGGKQRKNGKREKNRRDFLLSSQLVLLPSKRKFQSFITLSLLQWSVKNEFQLCETLHSDGRMCCVLKKEIKSWKSEIFKRSDEKWNELSECEMNGSTFILLLRTRHIRDNWARWNSFKSQSLLSLLLILELNISTISHRFRVFFLPFLFASDLRFWAIFTFLHISFRSIFHSSEQVSIQWDEKTSSSRRWKTNRPSHTRDQEIVDKKEKEQKPRAHTRTAKPLKIAILWMNLENKNH